MPVPTPMDDIRQRLAGIVDPLALLEGIFTHSPVALQIYRADGHCLLVNQAFLDLFGAEPPPEYNVLEDDIAEKAGVLGLIRRAFTGETVSIPPVWYDPRDLKQIHVTEGRRVCMESTFFPLHDANGKVAHVAITFKDVTEVMVARERAETRHAVAESEKAELHSLFMQVPAPVFILRGPELTFEMANDAARRAAGGMALNGRRLEDALPGLSEHGRFARQVLETGEPLFLREMPTLLPGPTADTSDARYFDVVLEPLRGEEGTVDGIIVLSYDVTEEVIARRQTEELAAQANAQHRWLEEVLDLLPTPLLFVESGSGRVTFANKAAERLGSNGRDADPSPGVPVGMALPPVDQPRARAARGERLSGMEVGWPTSLGVRTVLCDSEPLPAMFGHRAQALLTLRDVTELKQIQRELTDAVRMRDDFVSIASHELRTPLTALLLGVQTMRRQSSRRGDNGTVALDWVEERAERFEREARRLERLVAQLLDFSRISSGRLELHPEPLDLATVIHEVGDRFQDEVRRSGCTLAIDLPPALDGVWDRMRLDQILTNLISNAIKYGAGNSVEVRAARVDDRAVVTVTDHGIGIPSEAQQRIFGRFERAVSDRQYGGFGLGLWIVRESVEALGGRVTVESRPGEGATFRVELPTVSQEIAPPTAPARPA
jgi:signal transduction histidine kinase